MYKRIDAKDSILFVGAKHSLAITVLAPGNILITVLGYNDGEMSEEYFRVFHEQLARYGYVNVYVDCREQTGVTPAERDRIAQLIKAKGPERGVSYVLVRSKMMDLAIAIINMFTGGSDKSFSKVEDFEAAIANKVPGFRRLPTIQPLFKLAAGG